MHGFQLSISKPMAIVNRPHYHVWLKARTGRIFYRLARGFHTTRQAASQWGKRRQPVAEKRMVLKCTAEKCRPKLD